MVKVNQAERGREFVDRISINLSLYTHFTLHSRYRGSRLPYLKSGKAGYFPDAPLMPAAKADAFAKHLSPMMSCSEKAIATCLSDIAYRRMCVSHA